jgi:hypothetical protein
MTGKSTVGGLLAEQLNVPRCSMDELRWGYYSEIGWDKQRQTELWEQEGFAAVERYWKPFEIHAVERLLSEHRDCSRGCVIDFGAGHSVYEDAEQFARAERALAPFANVVLILPDPDLDESVRILTERSTGELPAGFDHTPFVKHPSNHRLAKYVVYTKGKTPEHTRDEIIGLLLERGQ